MRLRWKQYRGLGTTTIVAGLLLTSLPLAAADTTEAGLATGKDPGAVLLERCEPAVRLLDADSRLLLNDAEYADAQFCIGFVEGFIWGHGWAAWREGRDMYYCPPEGFSAREAVPVVVAYLRAHRDRLDADSHLLVFAALNDAYPCRPPGVK